MGVFVVYTHLEEALTHATDPRKIRKEKPRPVTSKRLHPELQNVLRAKGVDLRRVEFVAEKDGTVTGIIEHNQPVPMSYRGVVEERKTGRWLGEHDDL